MRVLPHQLNPGGRTPPESSPVYPFYGAPVRHARVLLGGTELRELGTVFRQSKLPIEGQRLLHSPSHRNIACNASSHSGPRSRLMHRSRIEPLKTLIAR